MKTKHTPGPWKWREICSSQNPAITVALELRTEAGMPHNDQTVLSVREDWIGMFNDYQANARLIAAAPCLLSALKLCHEELDRLKARGQGVSELALGLAEDALKKAEGK